MREAGGSVEKRSIWNQKQAPHAKVWANRTYFKYTETKQAEKESKIDFWKVYIDNRICKHRTTNNIKKLTYRRLWYFYRLQ